MADGALINLTRPQFENLMETQGLANTVDGILSIANDELDVGGVPLTREALQNGTHPLLDQLDRYKNLAPEQRNISDEEILTLFTNVEDFGKYDPSDDSFFGPGTKAVAGGAKDVLPEAIGAAAGARLGVAAASPIAAMIPPVGLPGLAAKGIVLGVGGLGGAILGMLGGGAAEEAVMGPDDPVVPSLEGKYRAGETATEVIAIAGTAPWKLIPKIPKAKTGAIEFVENFKNVASGKFTNVADDAFQMAARDAGLNAAQSQKLFDAARKAREVASQKGPMFGGALGTNLGFTRFNPAGYLADPRKGPLGARIIGGIEGGIEKSLAQARANPRAFLALEGLLATGAGAGAMIAQDAAPYDEGARIGGELLGQLIIPLPVQIAAGAVPDATKYTLGKVRSWWGGDEASQGLMRGKMERDSARRILQALQKSDEFKDVVDEKGNVVTTADERLNIFIKELGEAAVRDAKRVSDADGDVGPLTVADLAQLEGLDFNPTLRVIQQELAKTSADLKAATGRGREELQMGAVNAVRALAATGDPAALAVAGRIQQSLFEQNILDNVENGVGNLFGAAKRVLGREPGSLADRADLSQKLYDVLKNQIDLSKTRERRLWADVKNFPLTEFYARNGKKINQPNVLQLLGRPSSRGGLNFSSKGAQGELDSALGGYKSDLNDLAKYFQDGQGRNPATAQKFFEMRSGLMNKAAQLRKVGDIVNAQRLDKINDALLRDLTGQRDGVSEAYNTARAYTFARNNVFTRSFISDLQVTDRNRGLVLEPQELLDAAFRGGNLATARRFEQIRAAGRFLIDEAGFTEEAVRAMDVDQIMTAALRDSLGKVMDKKMVKNPATGEMIETFVVNPNKLETWKKQPGTKELFTLVNDLEQDFANAQTAQKAFDGMLDDISDKLKPSEARRLKFTDEQMEQHYGTKAFQWVLQYEDPGEAVAEALAAEKPSLALNALYRMVNEADYKGAEFTKEEALAGLKQAIFNNALREANNNAGLPNGDVLQRKLFTQIPGVRPDAKLSMSDFMIRKGLATEAEMEEVQKAVKTIRGIEEAFATNNFENVLFKNPSMGKLFWLRIGGATAGTAAQQQLKKFLNMPQMSGGLIAEQTGSEMVQKFLLRGPETQRIKIMTEMFSNPKFLAEMMKEIRDKEMKDKTVKTIEAIMAPVARQVGRRVPIGLRATDEAITEEYEAPEQAAPPPPPVRQPTLPPANQQGALVPPARLPTQGSGAAPSPTQFASATPQSPPSTPSGTVDRARFAALFPEDRDLMGIASLAGQG